MTSKGSFLTLAHKKTQDIFEVDHWVNRLRIEIESRGIWMP